MRNPFPNKFRRPLDFIIRYVIGFLATIGLYAIAFGKVPIQLNPPFVGLALGSLIAFFRVHRPFGHDRPNPTLGMGPGNSVVDSD